MRSLLIIMLFLATALSLRAAAATHAASTPIVNAPLHTEFHSQTPPDAADDDTVAVQLTVLGIVIGTVFVLGSAAYVLRVKLGRTIYTPPTDTGHH